MKIHELNELYKDLDCKAREICGVLRCSYGYFNGHYSKNERGDYEIEYYPIPVISLKGVCDVEIGLDRISVTTKLTKDKAISYDYKRLDAYSFEAYGVNDYLNDFFVAGDTTESMIEKISNSDEENIFYSFYFPRETSSQEICEFIETIEREGFFY